MRPTIANATSGYNHSVECPHVKTCRNSHHPDPDFGSNHALSSRSRSCRHRVERETETEMDIDIGIDIDIDIDIPLPTLVPCSSSIASEPESSSYHSCEAPDSVGEYLHKHYHHCITPTTVTTEQGQPSSSSTPTPTPPTTTISQQHQHRLPVMLHFHPQKETMKRHRRDRTATFGMVGAGVGTLLLPVLGTVAGGVLSGYAANQYLKMHEKKIQRKWERDQFQRDASASQTAMNAVFA